MRRQYIAFVFLLFSLLSFVFFILPALNIQQFLESFKDTNQIYFLLAILSILVSNINASLRWSVLIGEVNGKHSSRFTNALGIFCFGQIAGLIVPSRVGNYIKIPWVKKLDNLTYESIISAVNAETILDLSYICCAGIVSIIILSAFFSKYPYFSYLLTGIVLGILVGSLIILYNIHRFKQIYERLILTSSEPNRKRWVRIPAKYLAKLFELVDSTRVILSKTKIVTQVSLLTIITQVFGVIGLFFILLSVHASLPMIIIFAVLTLTYIVGIVSLIPGGLGVSDLSLIALLGYEGISLSVATNIVILWRIAMYLPILIVVGIFLIPRKIQNGESV